MDNAITIRDLHVSYDEKVILEHIDLDIRKGKITGVVGPNGSGKSTLFKAILGLLESNAGTISITGKDIEHVRKSLAYVPQKDGVNWEFPATVSDVVIMGRYPHKSIFQGIGKKDWDIAVHALEDVGMTEYKDRQIGELSGGQQQRVFIARTLCQQAEFLFLDEPFVGVDIKTEEKIVEILKNLAKEGKTILVIHHDLSKIKDYFDDLILINRGIVAAGTVEETFTKANVEKAYGGSLPFL